MKEREKANGACRHLINKIWNVFFLPKIRNVICEANNYHRFHLDS